ncbi:MAG: hypothetical protein CV089_00615 [Nitrospira sp. WS110]|nr:hypothetical protein [Nitrospira sp. WS110]
MTLFFDRMIRAAKLDAGLYEEVEADRGALGQAMGVVLLSSVATGIGLLKTGDLEGLVIGTAMALFGWYIWAFLTYFIGTRLLPEPQTRATHNELLRTIGFASSPGILRVLAMSPSVAPAVLLVTGVWMLVAMIIAVRQALDYQSMARAVGVCVIGWIVQGIILMIVFNLFGGVSGVIPGKEST